MTFCLTVTVPESSKGVALSPSQLSHKPSFLRHCAPVGYGDGPGTRRISGEPDGYAVGVGSSALRFLPAR